MNNLNGLVVEEQIAVTERGTLWRASRYGPADRILRKIDPRFCDTQFMQALGGLQSHMQLHMLPIVGEGWLDQSFCIEYACNSPWQLFKDCLPAYHWRQRLYAVYQVCESISEWERSPIHPLGLNSSNIAMVDDAGTMAPWLLPCPPLAYNTPLDLWDCEVSVLACLAPEIIRGIYADFHLQDGYAAAALAAMALGCPVRGAVDRPDLNIETQVRSQLLSLDLQESDVDAVIQSQPAIHQLLQAIRRYTLVQPHARPVGIPEIRNACTVALKETEAETLAFQQMSEGASFERVLEMLDWGFRTGSDSVPARQMASDLCWIEGDYDQAIVHMVQAIVLSPGSVDLRRQLCELRLKKMQQTSPLTADQPDPEGDALLADLDWLMSSTFEPLQQQELAVLFSRVYQHRQDFVNEAQYLYLAVELAPADLNALYLYAQCLMHLDNMESVQQVINIANGRIEKMVKNEMLIERIGQEWREKFGNILPS